mgnify:CR=1 FL=1
MSKSFEDLMNMSDEEIAGIVTLPGEKEQSTETNSVEKEADSLGSTEGEDADTDADENAGNDKEGESESEAEDDDKAGNKAEDDEDDADADDAGSVAKDDPKPDAKPDAGKTGQKPGDKPKEDGKADPKGNKAGDDKAKADQKADAKAVDDKTKDNKVEAPDYEKLYKEIMKPFKANGRMISLNSPEEAVQLMQMGANYTKKMQALQPTMKIIKMLENNQLLDETKLSHLIDVARGDKGAIAKIVQDSGVDPMDIDADTAVNYKAGNHRVSDSEISFAQIVEETTSTEHGADLIVQMNHVWDQASKKAIFKEPELIRVLATQKANGIYDQIAEVIEKQRMLGNPQIASLPFIEAYQVVGDALQKQGVLRPRNAGSASEQPAGQAQSQPQELGRAPAPQKKPLTNDAKAKAASPSGKSSKTAKPNINLLEMSDEDFIKWADRV